MKEEIKGLKKVPNKIDKNEVKRPKVIVLILTLIIL